MRRILKFPSRAGRILLSLVIAAVLTFNAGVPQVQATVYSTAAAEANKDLIYNYLVGTAGYNSAVACGIMANIQNESGFLPNNVGDVYEYRNGYTDESFTEAIDNGTISRDAFMSNGTGYGLCQWTASGCKGELYDLAKSRGTSIGDLTTQLVYLCNTIKSYGISKYLDGISNSADGAYKAAYNFCYYYEQPYNTASASATRGTIAENTYWPSYGNKTVTASASTSTSTTSTASTTTTPVIDTAETTSGVEDTASTETASTETASSETASTETASTTTETASADTANINNETYTTGSWTLKDTMTVRSGADTSASAIGYLNADTVVEVTAVSGRFGQISYNGQTAWVSLKYATKNGDSSSTTAAADSSSSTATDTAATVSTDTNSAGYSTGTWVLNTTMTVRSAADPSSTAVGYLKEGTTVNVTAVDGRFGQINYNGQTEWVSLKFAKKTGEAAASSTSTTEKYVTGSWRLDSEMTIRSAADVSSSSLGTIEKGATIIVTEVNGHFGKFDYQGQTAWISLEYATRIG